MRTERTGRGGGAAIGIADFFTTLGNPGESPDRFWMAVLGLPIASGGLWLIVLSFAGPYLRNLLRGLGRSGPACRSCGAANRAGARYCDACAAPL